MRDGVKIFIKNEALGAYLLILRDNKPDIVEPNTWGLVGGGLDHGEDPKARIEDKIREEVGIEVTDIKQIHEMNVRHTLKGQEYTVKGTYFIGRTKADNEAVSLKKGQESSFFTLEEIRKLPNLSFAVSEILQKKTALL